MKPSEVIRLRMVMFLLQPGLEPVLHGAQQSCGGVKIKSYD